MTIDYLDRGALLTMVTEVLLRQEYAFLAGTGSPVIVDAGANIGLATLAFKRAYPQARVLAFEPEPATFEVLERNVAQNELGAVELFPVALGREPGTVRLQGRPGSLATTTVPGGWSDPATTDVEVPVARLSGYLDDPVDLLKIDIEGAENDVLHDLAEAGKLPLIREMVVEFHQSHQPDQATLADLLRLLEDNGFGYQLAAQFNEPWVRQTLRRPSNPGPYQNILLHAYREAEQPSR